MAGIPHTGVLAFLYVLFVVKPKDEEKEKENLILKGKPKVRPIPKPIVEEKEEVKIPKADPLKEKGDLYERFIGEAFEKKGELVIYNGFIYGYADKGVDLISICSKKKTINLIQCKNWNYKKMFIEDIEEIYQKLSLFGVEDITDDSRAIKSHLKKKKNLADIEAILQKDKRKFKVRKTLYMSSDKVIDLNIGIKLKQIKANIFQYEDMKIVMVGIF